MACILMVRSLDIVAANARPGTVLHRLHAAVQRVDEAVFTMLGGHRAAHGPADRRRTGGGAGRTLIHRTP
ncbi:MAG: hypothetical protein ABI780_05120 [Ardenticatenales bacterium]